jgi:hypothetical protein
MDYKWHVAFGKEILEEILWVGFYKQSGGGWPDCHAPHQLRDTWSKPVIRGPIPGYEGCDPLADGESIAYNGERN